MRKKEEHIISKVAGRALIFAALMSLLLLFDNIPRFYSGYLVSAPTPPQQAAEHATSALPPQAQHKYVADELLVRFKPGATDKLQDSITKRYGSVNHEIPHIKVKVLKVNPQALDAVKDALAHNPAVDFVENNYIANVAYIQMTPS